jgi:hypothetical protein
MSPSNAAGMVRGQALDDWLMVPALPGAADVAALPERGALAAPVGGGVFDPDWQDLRKDDCTKLDVRLLLKTTDGALIVMTYQCLRSGSAETLAKLDRGEAVDPASYYFRFIALFETSAPKYDWINRIVAIGIGERLADGPLYDVFEVL